MCHAIPPGALGSRSSSGPHSPSGAVGSTSGPALPRSAAYSGANNYNRMTLEALLNAPSRELQPHLHPRKLNGALWFGVDPSVHKFIRTTWQAYYMGPWSSWKFVPQERKNKWWQTFVKRLNQKPNFISESDWTTLLEFFSTEPARKRSKSVASSRMTPQGEKGVHKHCAGPQNFLKIEYDMMVESGLDEPPPYTDLVRKTHTRSDGTFVDGRSESLVLEVEEAMAEMTADDGSPHSDSQSTSIAATSAIPTRILLNQEFLKRSKTKRGRVYGIGSVQLRDFTPTETVHESHTHTVDMDMRISGLETNSKAVNSNVETLKEDVLAMRGEFKEELATVKNEMVAVLNAFLQKVGTTPLSTTAVDASPPPAAAASTNPANTTNPSQQQPTLDEMCASLLGD
ncbi:unnamed protein product [Thlaspi arvense]|uniref:Transposase n=1 Tax=Thlaspi arvense TaxID=13288 RepID=A0AAU9SL79_THLAR|nr:unnamed protein product [Thlaspi arvense]